MKRPDALVYLNREGMHILFRRKSEFLSLQFVKAHTKNLEVKDPARFQKNISTFIQKNDLNPMNVVLVLSDDITFKKALKTPKENKIFMDEVPFEPKTLMNKVFKTKKGLLAVATNKSLIENVKKALENSKWGVVAIIPEVIFTSGTGDPAKTRKLLNNMELIKQSSMGGSRKLVSGTAPIVVGIFLLLGMIIGAAYFVLPKLVPSPETKLTDKVSVIEVVEVVEEIEKIEITRSDYSLQVLNGTGVSGLAAKTGALIEELGYTAPTLGNATLGDDKTLVQYNSETPTEVLDEIEELLNDTFEEVILEELTEAGVYDVIVVTGKLLTE